jgi:hypothetical protein
MVYPNLLAMPMGHGSRQDSGNFAGHRHLPVYAVLLLMWRTIPERSVEKAGSMGVPGTLTLAMQTRCLLVQLALGPVMPGIVFVVGSGSSTASRQLP